MINVIRLISMSSQSTLPVATIREIDWLTELGYRTKLAPMHLGLADRPFVPHVKSWEPCCLPSERTVLFIGTVNCRWNDTDRGKMKYFITALLCPTQFPHGLAWQLIQANTMQEKEFLLIKTLSMETMCHSPCLWKPVGNKLHYEAGIYCVHVNKHLKSITWYKDTHHYSTGRGGFDPAVIHKVALVVTPPDPSHVSPEHNWIYKILSSQEYWCCTTYFSFCVNLNSDVINVHVSIFTLNT
jgi:hypothetical protein